MRPWSRRLATAAVATGTVLLVLPAAPASATNIGSPLTCSIDVGLTTTPTGTLTTEISASVSGACKLPGWTMCDITIFGAPEGIRTARVAGYGSCGAGVSMNGIAGVTYVAVGRVGYSAADVPAAVAVTQSTVPEPSP